MDSYITTYVLLFLGILFSEEVSAYLKCLECTHMVADQSVQFENSQNVYKILQSKYNPACSYENPMDRAEVTRREQEERQRNQQLGLFYPPYQYDVGETICGAVSSDNKCQFLYGDVEVYLDNYKATLKLKLYVRNCIKADASQENVCYKRDTSLGYSEIKNFIGDKLGFITPDISNIKFTGNQCLCGSNRCTSYTGSSPNLVLPSLSGLLLSLVAFLLFV